MPNRNIPSWSATFLAVRAAFPGTTSPFTATRYPKAESTDMARSPTPAVVLALRIDWLVSASPLSRFVGGQSGRPEVVSRHRRRAGSQERGSSVRGPM